MSEPQEDIIQAQHAPLSHLSEKKSAAGLGQMLDWRSVVMAGIVVVTLVVAIVWRPAPSSPASVAEAPGSPAAAAADGTAVSTPPGADAQLAPFAQTQRQRVRTQAQDALSEFVERQILLEENMQVDAWGAEALGAALEMAKAGDAAFLKEQFDEALDAYSAAVASINSVLDLGNQLFAAYLAEGLAAIAALEPQAAVDALQQALTIKPEDNEARAALERAQQLPDIIGMLRTAKNHELGGRFQQALDVYDKVAQLDPATTGLAQLRAAARAGQAGDDLSAYISQGFSALENRRFEQAKTAFNSALRLDPDNNIAKGGLQQVAERSDLARIQRLQNEAQQALQDERWQQALDAYDTVLQLDANIQFALNGSSAARQHLRAQNLLEKISSEPQKLSSQKLYLDAVAILEEARTLEHAGPKLTALTATVAELLVMYRDPVDVVLLSDNATRIIMSNVGELGYFERKTLSLRPGQYTIRGSQNGCRDIYLSVDVLPGIAPLDLSCREQLQAGN